jgi:hypothetical protein|tara:strand:- start:1440 stop:1610 length:171 start_codon:yes stop_codon:yes gene_type:complete
MIDNKHDSINWGMIGVLTVGVLFLINVWFNGLFISTMELIIVSAIIGIIIKLRENR